MAAAAAAGTLRCSIAAGPSGGCSSLRSDSTAVRVSASSASSRFRCAAMRALRAGASGAASTALTSVTGISKSRSRRMTCAVGICPAE
jgi:hypothetical protein